VNGKGCTKQKRKWKNKKKNRVKQRMVKRYYNTELSVAEEKKTAKAKAANANVSLKYAVEICNQVKGKTIEWTEAFLKDIEQHKRFLPLKRYNKRTAHRKGDSVHGEKAGRYPEKTVRVFLKLLGNAKANADYKGLDEEKLVVKHAFASQGFARRGLQARGKMGGKVRKKKSAHLEIVLMETR
jgi:large subunit ribosomal protein L22